MATPEKVLAPKTKRAVEPRRLAAVEEPEPAVFAEIPLAKIAPSPDNPRRKLGDLSDLVASITLYGILEPLVVTPCIKVTCKQAPKDHEFHAVMGHRRHAAAGEAGLRTAPCLVRAMTDKTRLATMLIENLHRSDLSPLDEAKGYRQLVGLKLSQTEIAKQVNRSQAHISKRLGLLLLPAVAQNALDDGRITIEQATALARMHEEPKRITSALKGTGDPTWEINRVLREFELAQKKRAAEQKLKADGVQLVTQYDRRGALGETYGVNIEPGKHAGEPCHAAYLEPYNGAVRYVCSDPKRHGPGGASKLKVKVSRAAGKSRDAEVEKRRAENKRKLAELVAPRRAFVKGLLGKVAADQVHQLVMAMWLDSYGDSADQLALELLGVAPDTYTDTSPELQLQAFAQKGARNALKALAAYACATGEEVVTPGVMRDGSFAHSLYDREARAARTYFAFLQRQGYELTDEDRKVLTEADGQAE